MVQGLIHKASIWQIGYGSDDPSGGAIITGTVVYENVPCRFQKKGGLLALQQQGYETISTYTALLIPVTLDVEERYEFVITSPSNHPFAGKRYRIIEIIPADFPPSDPRNYMLFTLQRAEKAHGLQ